MIIKLKPNKNFLFLFVLYISISDGFAQSSQKPNIVIIIGDDCTYSDLPLYGGQNVKTPEIDKLASEGMTFNKAYVSMAMCTPSRAELYTGLYPTTSGVSWNHANARNGTQSMVQMLEPHGYRTGLAGKTHIQPKDVFPFEYVEGVEGNPVSKTANFELKGIEEFINRNDSQPFALVVGLVVPHVPWTVGNPEKFDKDKLKLPPYLADTKVTRDVFAKYLAEIEVMDRQVGQILNSLKKLGKEDNTIVIFTSEQGAQFPFCKWTNYDNGVHTGMVVRWNGVTKPGSRTDALVQYADVIPTFLDIIKDNYNYQLDGSSFLGVLNGKENTHREYAYSMHNNIPEGPSYPIRAVTDGKFHYIRNLDNSKLYIERHLMGIDDTEYYWSNWMYQSQNESTLKLITDYMIRPGEELFDLEADPNNMDNLAEKSDYLNILKKLSNELDSWMHIFGDPGKSLDTEKEFEAQKIGEHFKIKNN